MRSSLLNLIIGVIWCIIWINHAGTLFVSGRVFEAVLEAFMSLPIGIGFVLDWVLYGRLKMPNFLVQEKWNVCDYFIFASGVLGVLTVILVWILRAEQQDLQFMGVIVAAIAAMHYLRRQIRKQMTKGSM